MKKTSLFLALLGITFLLGACSVSNCVSEQEESSDNFITGKRGGTVTIGTLCTDRTDYNKGDTIHISFTVKNALDDPIVLDGGQQPVMDVCVSYAPCLSHYQPDIAQLTHLELAPGQSHTIQWNWPPPNVDMSKSVEPQTNSADVHGKWLRYDGVPGTVKVDFFYGARRVVP